MVWESDVVILLVIYLVSNLRILMVVGNIVNIESGVWVMGNGVGCEIYV